MTALQSEIEERLATAEPDVEVLLAEVFPAGTLRVFIDHPEGVTLGLCERVTALLSDIRERYSLEVSSPGRERPLTKPNHFRGFVGRRARVLADPAPRDPALRAVCPCPRSVRRARPADPDGAPSAKRAQSFTGELVGASDSEITLAADGGVIAIPYSEIRRSNLVEE